MSNVDMVIQLNSGAMSLVATNRGFMLGPAASVTAAMAAFIREHKLELLEELRRMEQAMDETKNDTWLAKSDTSPLEEVQQKPLKISEEYEDARRITGMVREDGEEPGGVACAS